MAEKRTLQHERKIFGSASFSIVIALGLSWVFVNQFLFTGINNISPDILFGKTGAMSLSLGSAIVIVTGFFYAWKRKWRIVSLACFFCSVLYLLKNGEIYNPYYLFLFLREYSYAAIAANLYLWSFFYFSITSMAVYGFIRPSKDEETGVHGTAEIQYGDHYAEKKFTVGGEGELILGRHKKTNKILTVKSEKHFITFASTGSGKGVGSIIPNLLHYPNTVVVVDPKGENCNFTAEHRQNFFDQEIICLDPFRESVWGKENGTNHFNPLDAIPHTFQKAFRPCNALVDTIFAEEIKGDPFWIKRAKNLYLGFLIYICTAPEYNDSDHPGYNAELRNLSTVNHLFSIPAEDLMAYIEKISVSDVPLNIKKFANEFLSAGASVKMLIGITETLKGEIQLFHSPEISAVMSGSDFSYDDAILDGATIYLIVPPEELRTYSKWTRIIITTLIQRAIYIRKTDLIEAYDKKILFLLDEFTNLGKLDVVRNNYSIARGYGLQFWIIFQDLGQLKPLYKKSWTSFFSNADIVQVFGVNDIDTADYISRILGETTIVSVSKSKNKNLGFKAGGGESTSQTEQKRKLYNPDEIKRFPKNLQFLITNGEYPIVARKITYYDDATFNPYTPTQTEVFTKLKELPRSFDINSDEISLEHQLRSIIHGPLPDSSSATEENPSEPSTNYDKSRDTDINDLGDDFDLSPFR